jgi:hypothetical protein
MLIMPIIYIVHEFAIEFWLHMQLTSHYSLFMDEYNSKAFTLEDEEDSSCTLIEV